MSRKTKLYVEPGTKLDWDNENHYRILEEEAFTAWDCHPKPTLRAPERSTWWWFWRAFGMAVYEPGRTFLLAYMERDWVYSSWRYRWVGAKRLEEWIDRGPTKGPRSFWFRRFLYWVVDRNPYSQCLVCGFTELNDEYTVDDGGEGRVVDMFEHVEGGGVDYWGEGQDAYGWMWCYRCGAVSWEAA